MKFKKVVSSALCLVMACGSVATLGACGGGSDSSSGANRPEGEYTTITLKIYEGGGGLQWIYDAAERFQEKYATHPFEDGKKGVYVDIAIGDPKSDSLAGENYHMILDERDAATVSNLAKMGDIVSLDDIVTKSTDGVTLESRINENVRAGLQYNGKYYALPSWELFPGLSFDADAFKANCWYLAKDEANAGETNTFQGCTISLIADENAEKSCGPDGAYGTMDDGLPASFEQLLSLCDYIKDSGVAPFEMSGRWQQYMNYLYQALWASLAGYEELSAVYNFTGTAQVVTGFKDTNLYSGTNYEIKEPIVAATEITNENGYLADHTYSRYLAASFIEIALREQWFTGEIGKSTGDIDTMNDFVRGGDAPTNESGVFLIEGSYWYNKLELVKGNSIESQMKKENVDDLNLQFMSMPTWVKTSDITVSSTPKKQTMMDNGLSYMYINAKFKDQLKIIEACKTFLEFLYSNEELVTYTLNTGVTRPMNYELSESQLAQMPTFKRSVVELAKNSNILYFSSSNPVFLANMSELQIQFSCNRFSVEGSNAISSYVHYTQGGGNAQSYFEATKLAKNETAWQNYLNNVK